MRGPAPTKPSRIAHLATGSPSTARSVDRDDLPSYVRSLQNHGGPCGAPLRATVRPRSHQVRPSPRGAGFAPPVLCPDAASEPAPADDSPRVEASRLRLQEPGHQRRRPLPVRNRDTELLCSGSGERIKLNLALCFGNSPLRANPALFFQAYES